AGEMARRLAEVLAQGGQDSQPRPVGDTRSPTLDSRYLSRFNIRTFHSLCYLMLKRHWRLLFDRPFSLVVDRVPGETRSGLPGTQTKAGLLKRAVDGCLSDRAFRVDFKRYLWEYLLETDEADRLGGPDDPRPAGLETAAGIRVRSYAEREIANWLHGLGIEFLYDRPVCWGGRQLRPDFYLPAQDLYLEVWEFGDPGSRSLRRAKLNQYHVHGKRLVEVEREELLDFASFLQKMAKLFPGIFPGGGVSDSEPEDLDRLESPEAGYPEALKSFISLAEEVLDKVKNHSVNLQGLSARAAREKDRRTRSFYRLFLQVCTGYQELLQAEGALDFNDLVLQAAELLRRNPGLRESCRRHWRHVLVDEYQDVNTPQVELLKELVGPESSLTCVGDDWQSIYGFRGSDVSHIRNFSAEFPGTSTVNLRLNYRSGESIVGLSSHVIRKCKNYTEKQLVALNRDLQGIVLYRAGYLYGDGVGYVAGKVRSLVEEGLYRPRDILILYRRSSSYRLLGEALHGLGLKVRSETIHGAKGLEAPCVFLWGLVGGRGGFPGVWRDRGILRLVLPQDLGRRMDEERRVFYVALTRARERLFLITEQRNPSEFLKDAPPQYFEGLDRPPENVLSGAAQPECPRCGGTMMSRWRFCPFCYHGLEACCTDIDLRAGRP
ncbi:MAG: UvrD-helicase domain-containing protein, partial [Candidatus Glassbacteria bacterium]|nr:UvrD-helicase domain-containing protein [Candidatus Glassbacteria bacterium]